MCWMPPTINGWRWRDCWTWSRPSTSCVDHSLLLSVYSWILASSTRSSAGWRLLSQSLTGRTQQVEYEGQLSVTLLTYTTSVVFGVPQPAGVRSRSPVRLIHCKLSQVVTAVDIPSDGSRSHQYADDCQMYITTSVSDAPASVNRFARCIDDVAACMSASRCICT